ncbi:MAG: LabA-like NYN domain-containing protein [Candidatus Limnocylindrales bacterium]
MSKNVAVFVDVANIFYAAKAAGVDIDYVTLLKTSTAGRDFVRAYAYTGLDPDNENQRQFHQFLARHDYKVVSKDIRKYGDGKVKANLDIELVVDLMKTARNLDIAVVVSGDGDFAPAIRAVQEMGVRVEVVSFRGNTSSDLIEVADLFTDITQIARVEKGSARSGRRVAAEDDLSMTAVPDKESEGAPRRRGRGRGRPEREEAELTPSPRARGRSRTAAAAPEVAAEGLVVLPGERLSRAARTVAPTPVGEVDEELEAAGESEGEERSGAAPQERDEEQLDGQRRRRRRRGGRGRGRGRGGERDQALPEVASEEEEGLPEGYAPPPRLPQPTPFGSVWDSQLGVASGPVLAGEELEEIYEDEPEIPEYLLAERRQQASSRGLRGGQRGRGRGGAYQAALERERYGRTGTGGSTFAAPPPRRTGRPPAPARGGGGGRGGRPERAPRSYVEAPRTGADGDPWSEVPPELEAMLRAELARRPAGEPSVRPASRPTDTHPPDAVAQASTERPSRRRTAAKPRAEAAAPSAPAEPSGGAGDAVPETAPRRGGGRARTAPAAEAAPPAAEAAAAPEAKPKRATRGTRKPTASAAAGAAATDAAPAKPARARTARSKPAAEG